MLEEGSSAMEVAGWLIARIYSASSLEVNRGECDNVSEADGMA